MLTRSDVARRLGRSIATVRRMEGIELHPVRDASGINRFDPHEVEAVARERNAARPHRASAFMERLREQDDASVDCDELAEGRPADGHDGLRDIIDSLREERDRLERLIASERRQREEHAREAAKARRAEESELALAILETYDDDDFEEALEDGELDELLEVLEGDE